MSPLLEWERMIISMCGIALSHRYKANTVFSIYDSSVSSVVSHPIVSVDHTVILSNS